MQNLSQNFQLFFSKMEKNEWTKQLLDKESNFYFLIKEEVQVFYYKTGGFVAETMSFDDLYILAVEDTIRQISQSRSKWFVLDRLELFKKIKSRIVNNLKNLFDTKRKRNVKSFVENHNDLYQINSDKEIDDFVNIQSILKMDKEYIATKLKNYLSFNRCDDYEIEEICKIVGIEKQILDDVVDIKVSKTGQLEFVL